MANSSEVNSASGATVESAVSAVDSAEMTADGAASASAVEDAAVVPQADRVKRRHSPREMDLVWCKRIPSFKNMS